MTNEESQDGEPDQDIQWEDDESFVPRYNIAPRSRAVVVRRERLCENGAEDSALSIETITKLQTMRWGLLPKWSKTDTSAQTANTINARAETLLESSSGIWNSVKATKRCAVLCDGYYEWMTKGKEKIPHFIRHTEENKLMWMAGLWEVVTIDDQPPLYTFSIVTVPARSDMEYLHDRMPLVLHPGSELQLWLDLNEGWTSKIQKLLNPFSEPLTLYAVPKEVGKVGTNDPKFIKPVAERKDGIKAMFAKQMRPGQSSEPMSLKRKHSEPEVGQSVQSSPAKKQRTSASPKKEIKSVPRSNGQSSIEQFFVK